MKRKIEATHRTTTLWMLHIVDMAKWQTLQATSLFLPVRVRLSAPNSKGLRLTIQGSKADVWQGSKRQEGKDVTLSVMAGERPAASYVSSFLNWNFAGFLSGRNNFSK